MDFTLGSLRLEGEKLENLEGGVGGDPRPWHEGGSASARDLTYFYINTMEALQKTCTIYIPPSSNQ